MKKLEILKEIEQICRDGGDLKQIHIAVTHHREIAEAEEAAVSKDADAVLRFIEQHPDIEVKKIAKMTGFEEGKTDWMVERLEQQQYIKIRPVQPHTCFITQKGRDYFYDPAA